MTAGWLVAEALDRNALRFSLDRAPAVSRGPVLVGLSVGAGAPRYHCTVARPSTRWSVPRTPPASGTAGSPVVRPRCRVPGPACSARLLVFRSRHGTRARAPRSGARPVVFRRTVPRLAGRSRPRCRGGFCCYRAFGAVSHSADALASPKRLGAAVGVAAPARGDSCRQSQRRSRRRVVADRDRHARSRNPSAWCTSRGAAARSASRIEVFVWSPGSQRDATLAPGDIAAVKTKSDTNSAIRVASRRACWNDPAAGTTGARTGRN